MRPIVVTPLEFERRALLNEGIGEDCDVVCCGPGAVAAGRCVCDHHSPEQPIILAGLAGALRGDIPNGSAHRIATVIDEAGHTWQPTFAARGGQLSENGLTIISTAHTVVTPAAKRDLMQRSGADLVDLESAAFAAAATETQRKWAIVRGVSDGVDDVLPDDIESWIDEHGRTRTSAVIASIVRHPSLVGAVRRLRADSIDAMQSVAQVLHSMLAA